MENFWTILIAAITATVTTLLVEPVKILINSHFENQNQRKSRTRVHDIELFKSLDTLLQEGILKGTLFSVKRNAEFYNDYIIPADQYLIYTDGYEHSTFINQEIEKKHREFIDSLKAFEKDLFHDFRRDESGIFIPNSEEGMDKEKVKAKYSKLTDMVLTDYTNYRREIKRNYQI